MFLWNKNKGQCAESPKSLCVMICDSFISHFSQTPVYNSNSKRKTQATPQAREKLNYTNRIESFVAERRKKNPLKVTYRVDVSISCLICRLERMRYKLLYFRHGFSLMLPLLLLSRFCSAFLAVSHTCFMPAKYRPGTLQRLLFSCQEAPWGKPTPRMLSFQWYLLI